MNKTKLFTVGIATCYGRQNLVKAAESVVGSDGVSDFRFIIVADTIPIKGKVLKHLKEMGIEVIQNKHEGSQAAKFRQIIEMTKSEILVFTQDDIRFDQYALKHILEEFEKDRKVTMVISRVMPMPAKTFMERVLEVGVNCVYRIGEMWNRGDNYLLANGRVMAFRMSHLKRTKIPARVSNLDAYLYFENKLKGGKFKYAKRAVVWNKSPIVMNEHLHQSSRFQYSKEEISKYFKNVEQEYVISTKAIIKAGIKELSTNPIYTFLYVIVYVYTRIKKQSNHLATNPFWKADRSTKR